MPLACGGSGQGAQDGKRATPQDKQRIEESIWGKYLKVAASPEGLFRYPTGRAGLEALGYNQDMVRGLPEAVAAAYCGVGNPLTLGPIREGEAILDIGCGAEVDSIIAAMLAKASENARLAGVDNVTFQKASAEHLPFSDTSSDVVIYNGVFNLVVDKIKALGEVFRVLKPGGRFMLADQVLSGKLPKETKARVQNWAR